MSVFKSYLRQLIRQLKALKAAEESGNREEVRRIIDELSRMPRTALRTIRACLRRAPGDIMMFRS